MVESIEELCHKILHQKFSFENFSAALKHLNIDRVMVDFVRKEHVFYYQDGTYFVHGLPSYYELVVAKTFDCQKVQDAILAFDRNIISLQQFHVKLAAAGVLSATAFYADQQALYLGQHCNFYLEKWDL